MIFVAHNTKKMVLLVLITFVLPLGGKSKGLAGIFFNLMGPIFRPLLFFVKNKLTLSRHARL